MYNHKKMYTKQRIKDGQTHTQNVCKTVSVETLNYIIGHSHIYGKSYHCSFSDESFRQKSMVILTKFEFEIINISGSFSPFSPMAGQHERDAIKHKLGSVI